MKKICKKCQVEQPIEQFPYDERMSDNYKNECASCRRERENKKQRKKRRCPSEKRCPVCEEVKTAVSFNLESDNKDNLASICIECGKDRGKVRKYRNRINRVCNSCNEEKSGFFFPFTKHGYTTLYPWCKECLSNHRKETGVYDAQMEYRKERILDERIKEQIKAKEKQRHVKDLRVRMLTAARKRAAEKAIEFNITKDDLHIPEKCPVLGILIQPGVKGNYHCSPSIDRMDNSKGYIVGNVQIISMKANTMKNSGTPEELKALAKWIIENIQ